MIVISRVDIPDAITLEHFNILYSICISCFVAVISATGMARLNECLIYIYVSGVVMFTAFLSKLKL